MDDATYDTLQTENIAQLTSGASATFVPSTSPVNDPNSNLIKCFESLALQISELKATVHNQNQRSRGQQRYQTQSQNLERSPAPSTANRTPTCWYHRNFGTQANKCEPPCDFNSQPPPSTIIAFHNLYSTFRAQMNRLQTKTKKITEHPL